MKDLRQWTQSKGRTLLLALVLSQGALAQQNENIASNLEAEHRCSAACSYARPISIGHGLRVFSYSRYSQDDAYQNLRRQCRPPYSLWYVEVMSEEYQDRWGRWRKHVWTEASPATQQSACETTYTDPSRTRDSVAGHPVGG